MSKDNRVAYVVGRYPAVTHTFILREVRALRRLGFDVQCFSVWRAPETDLLSPIDREEWTSTDALLPPKAARLLRAHLRALMTAPLAYFETLARAVRLSSPGLRRRVLAVARFLWAIVLWDACRQHEIDHIHAHLDGTAPMIAMLAVEFADARPSGSSRWTWSHRMHGSKEFYDIHIEKLAERAASASFIACVSDYTRSQVMAFVPEELWSRLLVVRCGVDLCEFAPRDRLPRRERRILTVGRVDAMKGTVLLLQAVARLRDRGLRAHLTVVGDGPSRDKAVDLAKRLDISDQVTWEGAVGHDRLRDIYANSDVFCLPSFAEGIPIVLMEAMAMGIPVVASAITGIVELVETEVNGLLVRPGRLDQLTDALARLLQDPTLRQSLGRAGRLKVAADYDLERNVHELARLFRDGRPGMAYTEPARTSVAAATGAG